MFQRLITFWDNTSVYIARLVFYTLFGVAVLFMLGYLVPELFTTAIVVLVLAIVAVVVDLYLLYRQQNGIEADRILPDRLSNGDENKVLINLTNNYDYKVRCTIIDEQPYQLQQRNWSRHVEIDAGADTVLEYYVKPQERGEYSFGNINLFIEGPLKLARRRYIFPREKTVKVYPSYIQMRRYQLHAVATHLHETGVKRMRKLGHSMEFEQIKEYVRGDDYRTLNWKATARHGNFMVNTYTDERSQQIYCVVNKGRVMKMPFGGMTLLDYAINASLVLCNVALQKHDKAGLITFAQQLDAFIPADKKPTQINNILETLYKQQTNFLEPDFERLFSIVRNRITQRSLIVLFTNFESIESLERELPSLKRLAHYHLLVVIFFDNTELKDLAESEAKTTEDIYIKTIAEKYRYEKQLIARELKKHGIISVLSTPERLTINSLNKYLELKNNQSI